MPDPIPTNRSDGPQSRPLESRRNPVNIDTAGRGQRARPALPTPRLGPVAPPQRQGAPSRRAKSWTVVAGLIVFVLGISITAIILAYHNGQSRIASTRASLPCPPGVADYLPTAAASTLIGVYSSARFEVTLCALPSGQVYYHGVYKKNASSQITLPASNYDGGYIARNGDYAYEVVNNKLIITENGITILDEALTKVS